MSKMKVTISWSGGKDSAFALYKVLNDGGYEVVNLHTVIDEETKRVGLHGVREELIEEQAENIGLSLTKVYLSRTEDHEAYEALMTSYYRQCARQGIEGVVFGDIFLEDLKKYREKLVKPSGITPLFPLWKSNTAELFEEFIRTGFKTVICSANAALFEESQLGSTMELTTPELFKHGVDVCGENGEYHTLVFDGPIFKKPIALELGELVEKNYSYQMKGHDEKIKTIESSFLFQDLLLRSTS